MRLTLFSVIAGTTAVAPTAQAQDVQHGRRLALEVCATCHAVLAGRARSPIAQAPSFQAVATTPGMTSAALNAWLTAQDHPTMPNIILSQTDVQDVSAYILSLTKYRRDRRSDRGVGLPGGDTFDEFEGRCSCSSVPADDRKRVDLCPSAGLASGAFSRSLPLFEPQARAAFSQIRSGCPIPRRGQRAT